MNMKKSIKILLIVIGILLVVALGIGMSYAYWTINLTQTTANNIDTGCFSITFADKNNISLTNQFPVSDSEGLTNTPYSFTINNTCTINAKYQIDLETLNTTTLDLSHVKVAINKSSKSSSPALLNSFSSITTTLDNASDSRNIETGLLNAGASKTYELRLWVDEATTV